MCIRDSIKEYLSRGTYVFPPAPSLRLTKDVILFTTKNVPKWNPMNVCSYHLQEAGATPVQELSYALAIAIAVLDTVREDPEFDAASFPEVFGRISFFVNAGLRFVTEICKMRAFSELWDEIARERYGIDDPKKRIFKEMIHPGPRPPTRAGGRGRGRTVAKLSLIHL